jgi:hypothetical protein
MVSLLAGKDFRYRFFTEFAERCHEAITKTDKPPSKSLVDRLGGG